MYFMQEIGGILVQFHSCEQIFPGKDLLSVYIIF